MKSTAMLLVLLTCIPSLSTFAQQQAPATRKTDAATTIPRLIKFSGTLTGRQSGVVGVTFALYKDQTNGAPLWLETQNVKLDASGHYTALLGLTKPNGLPVELFTSGDAQWLGVRVENAAEQARVLLLSVPYALKAADAETLGGRPASAFALAPSSGTTIRQATSRASHVKNSAGSTTINALTTNGAAANFLPLWTTTTNLGSSTIFQNATTKNIGIGTTAPAAKLHVAGAAAVNGSVGVGTTTPTTSTGGRVVDVENPSGASALRLGDSATGGQKWEWQSTVIGGVGAMNLAKPSGTASNPFTVLANGNVGIGTTTPKANLHLNRGGGANADNLVVGNDTTKGLRLRDTGTAVDVESIGVPLYLNGGGNDTYISALGTGKVGVRTNAPTTAFEVHNASGSSGIFLENDAFGAICGLANCTAVNAVSKGNGGFGVFAVGGPGGYAAEFDGNVTINGNLGVGGSVTKGSGSFKIDHPLDPANKYLSHSFVESPDMMNIYNGVVQLNSRGEAWVTLPEYFGALNCDFRYQLTSIGKPQPKLYIAEEISRNRFKIAGGKVGGRVSWQVTGVRQDAYANAHRIAVEEDKPRDERGHYLHPELFGATEQQAIWSHRRPAMASHQTDPASKAGRN
jgi:trimeric autotransporter adhesin